MARIKDESVEAVKAVANIVDLVEARTRLRKVGGRYTGLCLFHEEKTPSFSVSPDRGTYHCFGCGVGGDAISFVRETENLDFVGAIEWLADRFHVPIEYDESSPHADEQRRRRERLHGLLEQAASFYERVLWDSETGAGAREYLASRGPRGTTCRSSGSASRRAARRSPARRATRASPRKRRGGRSRHPSRHRLLPARLMPARGRARPGDRVPGAEAPRRRSVAREIRQLARGRSLPQVERPLRPPPRARRDREVTAPSSSRGNTDVIAPGRAGSRARRGFDGNRAHRAPAARARPVDAASSSASTRTRPGRRRSPAGMELAIKQGFDAGHASRRRRSCGRSRWFRAATHNRRAPRGASGPARCRSRTRQTARVPAGAGRPERHPGVAGAPRRLAARERPARADDSASDWWSARQVSWAHCHRD